MLDFPARGAPFRTTICPGDVTRGYARSSEADARIRTADPFITSEVLYQLSYVGGEASIAAAFPPLGYAQAAFLTVSV